MAGIESPQEIAMADKAAQFAIDRSAPAEEFEMATANDNVVIDPIPRYVIACATGNLVTEDKRGVASTIPVVQGQTVPIRPRKVKTGSVATLLCF
jgi:hypothetical protein